ncbi:MAG: CusA/CzcA family heavy metal efflux RND transporter [Cyclobacteriaceae bacterium]
MFGKIIAYSVKNKFIVLLTVAAIVIGGIFSMRGIPLDAVPDITNNQVQVVTVLPTLAAEEVEQLITFPIEASLSNIPDVVEIRSISRYGLSVITVVFDERMEMLDARQYVREQLGVVDIPAGFGTPELMPITTGLGEIYQYVLHVQPGYEDRYDIMDLRTIQDWIVKRQLAGIPGVIEVSSFGGLVKEYEVAVNPERMFALKLTLPDVIEALKQNNENSGGSYIDQGTNALYIRTFGRLQAKEDIEGIMVAKKGDLPVYLRDIATVQLGSPKRYGAMTMDGKGEVVGGITLMLKGSNSSEAIANVQERVALTQSTLPEGVKIEPYLDRSELIGRAINTVSNNLIEGGLIVIFVLVLLLGNLRGGLIVASVIPLSMLFAFMLMRYFGVSANLMSLGAIDFGIVVDGAVIIVEAVLHTIYSRFAGSKLNQAEMDRVITDTAGKIYNSAAFGVLIILVVFIPVMTLIGIEGKMFRPMAFTVSFAILGAMILSMTYVPVMASLFFKKEIKNEKTFADKIVGALRAAYKPSLNWALKYPKWVITMAFGLLLLAGWTFSRMGGEFIPNLEEGDLAMQMTIQPGSSLTESIKTSTKAEKILLDNFPEVKRVVSKIGTAEVPTDPMAIEDADIMILLDPKDEWVTADNREDLVTAMKEKLSLIVGASFDFTQPIQLRFNELMTGAKTDIAIQIFGEDIDRLAALANRTAELIKDVEGVGDIKVEQTEGLPQLMVTYDREMMAYYGINVDELNTIIKSAYAGTSVGQVFENERQFDLVVRYDESFRTEFDMDKLWVNTMHGDQIPLSKVATAIYRESPLQISREQARRRINVGVNVRNRDVASLVSELQSKINAELRLPPGYIVTYGGQFENLEQAQARLQVAVPLALASILVLLYFTFGNVKDSLIIFMAVPFAAIGGVFALWLRDMPFSISAGVGFIALFGVAVLNGIVLIQYYRQLREEGETSLDKLVVQGGLVRLRPVIMTAAVASLGFLPMATSTTAGGEVQRPLATVVIGGLITSTLLTLIVLPVIYRMIHKKEFSINKGLMILMFMSFSFAVTGQPKATSLESLQQRALDNYELVEVAGLAVEQQEALKKQSYNPGNLNINYMYGQIDGPAQDYNLSIVQPLGNIPMAVKLNKAGKKSVRLAEVNKLLTEKLIIKEVNDAYIRWVASGMMYASLVQQRMRYENLSKEAQNAVASGIFSELEMLYVSQEHNAVSNLMVQARLSYEQYGNRLIELTAIPEDSLSLPDGLPEMYATRDTVLSPVFYEAFGYRSDVENERLAAARMGYLPNLNIGYFNQQLDGVSGYEGVQLGASLPLWFKPQKSQIQEQKITVEMVELESRRELNQLQRSLHKCLNTLESFDLQFDSEAIDHTKQIIQQSEAALNAGQLNLFDYIKVVSQAFESQRSLWETRQLYLLTISELKYYTE